MTDAPESHDGETSPATAPTRQTTAYLKQLFVQVGFVIDAKRGQNFLIDLNLLDLLERSAGITAADVVLEVGTGTGALPRGQTRGHLRGRLPACLPGPRQTDRLRQRDARGG